MITDRVRASLIFRLHRSVYSVVPPRLLKIEGHWLAAVLATGEGAGLAQLDAAALWGRIRPPSGPTHVIVPGDSGRKKRSGIVVHRSSTLLPSEIVEKDGIPVTTPARTLVDLRRRLPEYRFAPILRRAEKAAPRHRGALRLGRGPGSNGARATIPGALPPPLSPAA